MNARTLGTKLVGVIPPMMTPFRENGDLDLDMHQRNMTHWEKDELCGYLVLGSNSESAFLSYDEKLRLIETTAAAASDNRIVLAGTGVESTQETIRLTNAAAKRGAHAALVLTPCYYNDQMTDEALIAHFGHIADHSDIPILIYNVPKFTHINISLTAVARLSNHPNIIGMKDSTGDVPRLAALLANASKEFHIIVGTAAAWFPALMLGIECGILALANLAPNQCASVQNSVRSGNLDSARELYLKMLPVNAAITNRFGIAGLKYAADLAGYEGGSVRSPLLPLGGQAKHEIKEILGTAGLL
jgi:4-hydroxy-2-oxoglutarate aldolase